MKLGRAMPCVECGKIPIAYHAYAQGKYKYAIKCPCGHTIAGKSKQPTEAIKQAVKKWNKENKING